MTTVQNELTTYLRDRAQLRKLAETKASLFEQMPHELTLAMADGIHPWFHTLTECVERRDVDAFQEALMKFAQLSLATGVAFREYLYDEIVRTERCG